MKRNNKSHKITWIGIISVIVLLIALMVVEVKKGSVEITNDNYIDYIEITHDFDIDYGDFSLNNMSYKLALNVKNTREYNIRHLVINYEIIGPNMDTLLRNTKTELLPSQESQTVDEYTLNNDSSDLIQTLSIDESKYSIRIIFEALVTMMEFFNI